MMELLNCFYSAAVVLYVASLSEQTASARHQTMSIVISIQQQQQQQQHRCNS